MINIGIYISRFDYGGVSKYIINLTRALKNSCISTHILTKNNETKKSLTIFENNNKLISYIKENNINVIITNGWLDDIKLYLLCKVNKCKVKFIQVLHSDLSQLDMDNKTLKGNIKRKLIQYSFNNSDICLAVSKKVQMEINESGYFKRPFIHVYNPIIDESLNYSIKKGFINIENKQIINLIMIGWIRELKNQEDVIRALTILNDKRIKLNIVGGIMEEDYYQYLKNLVSKNNLEEKVIFWGIRDNAVEILKEMDVLILSSKAEALPTVLVEALACEVPIISSNCNHGPAEILNNGEYGILFESGNYEELAKSIDEIINNNRLYNELSKKSLERIKPFTYENINKEYISIINRLLS